jgi:hypothetical protein
MAPWRERPDTLGDLFDHVVGELGVPPFGLAPKPDLPGGRLVVFG